MMDTPNCAMEVAGMARIRKASNSKRMVRILNHLASSSFDCPVAPCGCELRGWRAPRRGKNSTRGVPSLFTSAHFSANDFVQEPSRREMGKRKASERNMPVAADLDAVRSGSQFPAVNIDRLSSGICDIVERVV